LMSSLEKRFGSWAIPNLTVYLIIIQVIGAVLLMGNYVVADDMVLHGSSVLDRGQWWRLVTFMMMPRTLSPLWLFISFMVFYLIGSSLEQQWGTFRFNLFIWSGYLLTVSMAFINPGTLISNVYFLGCVFLAFATLFPNFTFHLFFIIPVKVKWLGWLTFAFYVLTLFQSTKGLSGVVAVGDKLGVVAAFLNYALFFGWDVVGNLSTARRRKAFYTQSAVMAEQPRHTCAECGITEKTHPDLHFRYCSSCGKCFCENHIDQHQHV